jgi:yecA family protein
MTHDDIRVALETAVGVPEEAMRAAVLEPAALAPDVIAVARSMADGRLPLPREERLLRFGLHALAAARDISVCPAFLALLRRPELEVDWLLGEDRATSVAQLLLSLFDGDDAAVCAVIAEPGADDDARSALMLALARLVFEGRASRERALALLDRFDCEALAPVESFAWFGWQESIMLLGATELIERVRRGWEAGRLSEPFGEADRQDWLKQIRNAAEHPDDPERFSVHHLVPIDDPTTGIGWSADPPSAPDEAPSGDELAWLDVALLRTLPAKNMPLEHADGFLTALAAGPVRVPAAEYLAEILPAEGETSGFDSPEHKELVAALLTRRHDAIERDLAAAKAPEPWVYGFDDDFRGTLWVGGYLQGVMARNADWEPLMRDQRLANTLVAPLFVMLPDPKHGGKSVLSDEQRLSLIHALPEIALATKAYWQGDWHPLLDAPVQRAPKIGRNDPCPCGSGKKYKRCCGVPA